MIKIFYKTKEELETENGLYRWAATEVKGIPKVACPTYLVKKDGTKVDTSDLTEEEIMALITQDVKDFESSNGSYKTNAKNHLDSFDLIKVTEKSWTPSVDAILQTYYMENTYGHIMADIRGTMDQNNIVDKAQTIAKFLKESNGNFEPTTKEETIVTLQQMSYNEKIKKQISKIK